MSNRFLLSIFIIGLLIGVFSCSRELDVPSQLSGTVSFSFKLANEDSNARKLVDDFNLVVSAQITIIKEDGSATEITGKVMEVYESEGTFYIDEITLPVGKYQLTELLLLDTEGTALFAIPEKGELQEFIDAQLPISFEVFDLNKVKNIVLEVLSTFGYTPEDFGFDPGDVKFRPLLYFWVSLRDKYDTEKYLQGDLVIDTDSQYKVQIDSAAKVILDVEYEEALGIGIRAFAEGYTDERYIFSIDSLLKHKEEPLLVVMKKIQEEEKVYDGNVVLRYQEEVDEFGLYQYETIRGNLIIEGVEEPRKTIIQSLSGLKELDMVEGNFIVKNNSSLESFNGMNIKEVSGNFLIENNPNMEELSGLHEFRIIGGTLSILNNSSLVNYCAISKLVFEDPEVEMVVQNNEYDPTKEEIRNNETCAAD